MATLLENANRIKTDKENIRQAIISKGIDVPTSLSLDSYDEKINEIKTGDMKVYSVYADITAGTWEGAVLSDSSWVSLCTSNMSMSKWTYNFDRNIDINKIEFVSASMIENTYWFRQGRGYAQNSNTAQYQYFPKIELFGSRLSAVGSYNGGIDNMNSFITVGNILDNYSNQSSGSSFATYYAHIFNDKIVFGFTYNSRTFASIHSTTPKFLFTIGYTE